MTKDEALRMAIEFIESKDTFGIITDSLQAKVIQACKDALAETQEPIGYIDGFGNFLEEAPNVTWTPVYTTPSREWVGLSDEDKVIIAFDKTMPIEAVIAVTEAKLKEKNSA